MFFLELVMYLQHIIDLAVVAVKEKKKISQNRVNFVERSGAVLMFFTRYIPERECNKFWEQLKVLASFNCIRP